MTDFKIKNAKPKEKNYFLFDGNGLRLLIRSSGLKVFQIRLPIKNKEKSLQLALILNFLFYRQERKR
ncbi:hypothetical protein BKH41_00160 [Helicobacter sp. 12S02232-10]|nr:hypothetical protein BKH41_00160 [Helicobacter sp. 12S02232-10]